MATRLVLVHALSPLHAGTGQSVGAIDLPIARERPTGIPLIPGSSIKGALRARSRKDDPLTRDVFGPETAQSSEHAGSVQLSDAHLVLLPVRSVAGTFAWTTSPYLLRRFVRDAREARLSLPSPQTPAKPDECIVLTNALTLPQGTGRRVVLEDLDFTPQLAAADTPLAALIDSLGRLLFPGADPADPETAGWRQSLKERICLVHDDIMALLLETATEVAARVRLNEDTKTVAKGALWYEESLPAESILAGLAVGWDINRNGSNDRAARTGADLLRHLESLTGSMVQLGGKANVGRGSCLLRLGGAA
jgi:CRISPR-associated protein Cmr4